MTISQEHSPPRIGLVGLGKMGVPMAQRLVRAGHQVVGHDADQAARQRAADAGIDTADAFDDLVGVDFLVLMLPNSAVVEEVIHSNRVLHRLQPGSTIIDMGSSKPSSTQALARSAHAAGIGYVDAPVSGGVAGAEAGKLTIMVGGSVPDFASVQGLLAVVGSNVTHLGPPGAGHALKALNNLMSATHLLVTSEAMLVGQRFGLDPTVMLSAINTSSGRSGSTEVKWPKFIVPGTFDSGFALSLMLKDMRIAVELAQECGLPSRLGEAAVDFWTQAAAELPEGADHTQIAAWLAQNGPVG